MKRMERRGQARERRVLVVDDEPDIRELLELTLLKMGVGVSAVGTIGAARDALRGQRFDLCLTDMRLPDGDGLDLVRHIAAMGRRPARRGDHGLRQRGERGGRAQGRRVRLRLEAGRARAAAHPDPVRLIAAGPLRRGAQRAAPARGERPAQAGARSDRQTGAHPGADLHLRRVRQRQGARCPPDARERPAPRPALRAGQLRRDPRDAGRERVLRLSQRARSPAPTRTATDSSRPPPAARCSSTKSATCRSGCR